MKEFKNNTDPNQFKDMDELTMALMYSEAVSKLKPRGSNFTPPKKKRKKKNK